MLNDYELKWGQEALWVAVVAAVAAMLQIAQSTDPYTISDPKTYVTALGIAAARAALAAVWNFFNVSKPTS